MALFEGGARNADIITGTDSEGCILAVITFVDLDILSQNERYSQLARKLTTMFAIASIKKLRGMIKPAGPAPAPAEGAAATPAADGTAASPATAAAAGAAAPAGTEAVVAAAAAGVSLPATAPAPSATSTGAAADPDAAPSGPPVKKERVKKKQEEKVVVAETLYKNKMAKPAGGAAAGAAGGTPAPGRTVATAASLEVPQPKNIAEAVTQLQEAYAKLKKSEHAKRNQQVMLDKLNKQIKNAEEQLRTQEEQLTKLTRDYEKASSQLASLDAKHKEQTKVLDETSSALEKERKSRAEMESHLTLSHADMASRTGEELARLTQEVQELRMAKTDLEANLSKERSALALMKSERESETLRYTATSSDLTSTVERLQGQLTKENQRANGLDTELQKSLKQGDEQRQSMASQNMRLLDLEEKLSAAMSWKLKALEFQSGLDAEKKRHVRLSDDWNKQSKELETELKHYKLLLKTFAITIYAKEFRLRKLIGTLHKRVSEMLLTTLEEHYSTATGKEKGAKGLHTSSGGASGASSGAGGGAAAISTTFKSVRKRKKAYLDNLLKPTSKLRDVVSSLDDEVSKLKGPFEEIRERLLHWRATSESFFQRNVDLASKLMTLDKSLAETAQAKEHASAAAKQSTRDLERLAAKHADLSARVHGASSGGVGGGVSGSGHLSARIAGAEGGDGGASGGKDSTARSTIARQELELLEARATVLRVHVQQLEAHYLQLQQAIHNLSSGAQGAQQQQQQGPYSSFQHESKQAFSGHPHHAGGQQGDFNDRFDPSQVQPIPFPQYANGQAPHGMQNPQPPPGVGYSQQQQMISPRGQIVLSARGTQGGGVMYHPPAGAPVNTGYGYQAGASTARYSYGAPLSPANAGPGVAKPDVVSMRSGQQVGVVQNHPTQQKATTSILPAVQGATYAPLQTYGSANHQQQQQSYQAIQPQRAGSLAFTPRGQ
jgi:hypothetical protein